MADTFVVSNFAVSTLQFSITAASTTLQLAVDDVPRFPILNAGNKFPLVLQDSDGDTNPEIVYVTNLTVGGVATIERGREATTPQSWLAGTFASCTITGSTISGLGGVNPRGNWSSIVTYQPRDIVTYLQVSYLAVTTNLNSVPSSVSPDWQVFFQPPGAVGSAMVNRGRWSSSTAYILGETVEYNGRNYTAVANGTNNIPSPSSAFWAPLSPWGGAAKVTPVLIATTPNNYAIAVSPASFAPNNLYDGLQISVKFGAANTGPITIALAGLAAVPGRPRSAIEFASGQIDPAEVYEFTYLAATSEFVATATPAVTSRLLAIETAVAALKTRTVAMVGLVCEWYSDTLPAGGWAEWANGQSLTVASYPDLFAVIGYTYGGGGASFNVPDRRGVTAHGKTTMGGAANNGKLPAGSGINGTVIGSFGGAATFTLARANLPATAMPTPAGTITVTVNPTWTTTSSANLWSGNGGTTSYQVGGGATGPLSITASVTGDVSGGTYTFNGTAPGNWGNGDAFSLLAPSIICNYIIIAKPVA